MSSVINIARALPAIRFASDSSGTNFSATSANTRKWIGIILIDDPNQVLTAADFTGKWQKYVGDIELDTWFSIADGTLASYTLEVANGCQQKLDVSSNANGTVTLTAPVLSADLPTFVLEITKTAATNIQVGATVILDTSKVGIYQVCWSWNGVTTKRYLPVELF